MDLSEEELKVFLEHDQLRTPSEETVLHATLEWCKHNDKLNIFSKTLAPLVRFELVAVKSVLRYVREDERIRAEPTVADCLLDRVQSLSRLPVLSRPRFSTQMLVAMPYRSKNFYLITFFGDHIEFVSKQFPEMIHEHIDALINYSVCKVGDGRLYMAGGTGYNENNEPFHSNRGFVYDLVEDEWMASADLLGDSSNFGMAAVNNYVYAMGGDSFNSSDEVLRMDFSLPPRQREWTPVAPTNYARASVHLAAASGRIFAIGGMLDGGYTSTVEAYDPETGLWNEVDSMSQARCNPGVAVSCGRIYVVGGLGDNLLGPPGALKTAEFYDSDSDSWTTLPDMYFPRHSPAVALVDNKLFVFGGGSPSPLLRPGPERTIECFDFDRHEWFVLQAKIPGRSNAMYVGDFFDNLDT